MFKKKNKIAKERSWIISLRMKLICIILITNCPLRIWQISLVRMGTIGSRFDACLFMCLTGVSALKMQQQRRRGVTRRCCRCVVGLVFFCCCCRTLQDLLRSDISSSETEWSHPITILIYERDGYLRQCFPGGVDTVSGIRVSSPANNEL